jgi:hypothetical protein
VMRFCCAVSAMPTSSPFPAKPGHRKAVPEFGLSTKSSIRTKNELYCSAAGADASCSIPPRGALLFRHTAMPRSHEHNRQRPMPSGSRTNEACERTQIGRRIDGSHRRNQSANTAARGGGSSGRSANLYWVFTGGRIDAGCDRRDKRVHRQGLGMFRQPLQGGRCRKDDLRHRGHAPAGLRL